MLSLCQRLLPCLMLLLGVSVSAQQPAPLPAEWRFTGQARTATGDSGMVASGHPLASAVGRDILRAGGNAIDAAVAVGFALAVTHPEAGNIGGGGFMVARLPDGQMVTLDFRETAPAAASRNMYLDASGALTDRRLYGALASGVPGTVAGLVEAHQRYGRLAWARLVEPAIALARDGFVIDAYRSRSLRGAVARLQRFPSSARQFLINGAEPAEGTLFRQPDLARTLERIATGGRDGFYRGPTADAIVAQMRADSGIITYADLSGYQAKWRTPVSAQYRGWTITSMPPASSGGVTLAMLFNMQDALGPLPPFGSAELLHREAEVMRRAFMARNALLGDTDFETVPLARLLSPLWAREQVATIDLQKATPTPAFDPSIPDGNSTTSYSVTDALGGAVAITTTLNSSYGSHLTIAGAGFLMNNEMDDFATAPGRPNQFGLVQGEINAIKPGKRMLSAMSPSLVTDPQGVLRLVVGTPGGPTIITQVYHVISNVIDHAMPLPQAVEAPRLHHQALPDEMRIESPNGFAPAVLDRLRAMGHRIATTGSMGDVQAIIRTATGWLGVSDPRLGGGPSGY